MVILYDLDVSRSYENGDCTNSCELTTSSPKHKISYELRACWDLCWKSVLGFSQKWICVGTVCWDFHTNGFVLEQCVGIFTQMDLSWNSVLGFSHTWICVGTVCWDFNTNGF